MSQNARYRRARVNVLKEVSMRHVYPTIVAVLFAVTISTLLHTSTHAAPSVIVVSGNISVSTTWTSGNIYYVTRDTTVVAGVTLKIEPGVIVKFRSNSGLIIDGKLEAMGTASQPIYFTSYRDDSAGGDTNGDSSSGEKGDWNLDTVQRDQRRCVVD